MGRAAPAVPCESACVAVPPDLDAAFVLPFAAVQRRARECWLSTLPPTDRPPDALTGEELYLLHRRFARNDLAGHGWASTPDGPGKALVEGLKLLGPGGPRRCWSTRAAPGT